MILIFGHFYVILVKLFILFFIFTYFLFKIQKRSKNNVVFYILLLTCI